MTSRIPTPEQRAALDALEAVTRRLMPVEAQYRSLIAERDSALRSCLDVGAEKTAIAERGRVSRQTVHKRVRFTEGDPQ